MLRTLSVALASALALGCADLHHVPYSDPYAGLTANSPFKDMTAAVLVSRNTTGSDAFFKGGGGPWGGAGSDVLGAFGSVFKRNFKAAIRVETAEEARAIKPDVLAVLDVRGEINWGMHVTADAAFMTPAQEPIETLHAEAHHKGGFGAGIPDVVDAAARELERSLLASAKLADFARGARPSAAAPVPVVPVYHSDADEPGFALGENPDAYALVVGVEKYKSLPRADFAARDAEAVRRHLRALGFPERNVAVLAGDNATRTGMAKYFKEWLPARVTPRSTVFFYFSGHGAPDPGSGTAYLMPWDGDAQFLKSTAYPLKEAYEELGRLKARRVVVALDSCFSGAGGRSVLAKGLRPLVAKTDTGFAPPPNMAILAAASEGEVTGTLEDQGHGAFTYYLLKGLERERSAAAVRRLFEDLKPKVQDAARRQNRDQTPVLIGRAD